MKRKPLIILGLTVGMLGLGLTGCGSKEETQEKATSEPELLDKLEATEIVFWHAMSGSNGEAIELIVEEYNESIGKEHNIKVTPVFQDVEIASKIKMVAADDDKKNAPDVVQTVGMDVPSLVQLSQIVPAQTFLDSENATISESDYYEHLLRAFTYENQVMGIPMSSSSLLLYYNEDLLKESGFNKPPQTVAELAAYTEKLTEKKDGKISRYGLNAEITRYQLANFIVSQYPESFMGDQEGGRKAPMTKLTIDEDDTLEKFLTEWKKVVDSGGYKEIEDNANEEFATGVSAMTLLSSSRLGAIKGLVGDSFTYKVAYLPKVTANDTSGASVGGSSLMLYNRGDNKKLTAAWSFIEFATSAESQGKWAQATGYIPTNIESENLPTLQAFYEENPNYQVPLAQMKDSSPLSQEPFDLVNWEINDIVKDVMADFGSGTIEVDEAKERIVEEANAALDEYHRVND